MSTAPIREFEAAIDATLAPLESATGPAVGGREALARARRGLHGAAAAMAKVTRSVVRGTIDAQLRRGVTEDRLNCRVWGDYFTRARVLSAR
jgi:hypothetical protein